ncbi:MAG: hypothetical protein HDQ88_00555 [Clostridia bacterium]|nr:hypothetical protein [Clostridia bacterium]
MTKIKLIKYLICLISFSIISILVSIMLCSCETANEEDKDVHTLTGIWVTDTFEVEYSISEAVTNKIKNDWLNTETYFEITTNNVLYVKDKKGNTWPPYSLSISDIGNDTCQISTNGHPDYVKLSLRWYKKLDKIICTYSNNAVIARIGLHKSTI